MTQAQKGQGVGNLGTGHKNLQRSPKILLWAAESCVLCQDLLLLEILEYCAGTGARTREEIVRHIGTFRDEQRRFEEWMDLAARIGERDPEWAGERKRIRGETTFLRQRNEIYRQMFESAVRKYFPEESGEGGRPLYLEREIVP